MNTNNNERAMKIWNDTNATRQQYAKMGMALTGILACSVEQIEAHLNLVDDVNVEFGTHLDAAKFEIGTSREKLAEMANHRRHQSNGRKGVNALINKYGYDSAARIVKNHSGKTIR